MSQYSETVLVSATNSSACFHHGYNSFKDSLHFLENTVCLFFHGISDATNSKILYRMHVYGCKLENKQTNSIAILHWYFFFSQNQYYLHTLLSVDLEWNLIIYALSKILLLLASLYSIHT